MKNGVIIEIISRFCYVEVGNQLYQAEIRGLFRHQELIPVVGDYVAIDKINEVDKSAIVIKIYPRKNILIRPKVANIDQIAIVSALINPNLNSYLLNKYLAMIEFHNITPLLIFTKKDLLNEQNQVILTLINAYKKLQYQVIVISNKKPEKKSFTQLKQYLKNKITVFTGQSGVGKSSTLNKLDFNLNIMTQEISLKRQQGKHTTRYNTMINLGYGKVIDSPGFSAFNLDNLTVYDLAISYHFLKIWSKECKFRRCLHYHEYDCRVKVAVENKELNLIIYQDYLKLIKEKQGE